MLPRIFWDESKHQFQQSCELELSKHQVRGVVKRTLRSLIDDLELNHILETEISGEPAQNIIYALHGKLEEHMKRTVSKYSSFRWLWYIRRLPLTYLEGDHKGTMHELAALAEILILNAPRDDEFVSSILPAPSNQINFPCDSLSARRVLQFMEEVRLLRALQVELRLIAKGARTTIHRDLTIRSTKSLELEEAIRIFDGRLYEDGWELSCSGTLLLTEYQELFPSLMIWRRLGTTVPLKCKIGAFDQEQSSVLVNCSFIPDVRSFSIPDSISWSGDRSGDLLLDQSLIDVLVFQMCSPIFLKMNNFTRVNIHQVGYCLVSEEELGNLISHLFDSAVSEVQKLFPGVLVPDTVEGLICRILSLKATTLPLKPAGILIKHGNKIVVDLCASSDFLRANLQLDRLSGESVNIRSKHFERMVQNIIDQSRSRPPEALRSLVRRSLRVDGHDFTDIDAIALVGNDLLLISCKSKCYTPAIIGGDYRAIRNIANAIELDVRYWEEKISALKSRPVGDNYDITEFCNFNLLPIVCLPSCQFVHLGPATRFVTTELRAFCTIHELRKFIGIADE